MLKPRPYQQEGIDWLRSKGRAMLTDKPGLGKTLQGAEASDLPVLVACPTYLVDQWAAFLQQQYPSHKVAVAKGSAWARYKALQRTADWTICNIEMLRSYDFNAYTTLIIDESHRIKSRHAQQSIAALVVAERTPRLIELTGTPITREPDDLFMQLRLVAPDIFTSYWKFVDMFCAVESTPWGDKVVGAKTSLAPMLAKFALGRTYEQVSLDLPPLISTILPVRLNAVTESIYNDIRKTYTLLDLDIPNAAVLVQILRRILICKEKLSVLTELVSDLNEPCVIFCWYREAANFIGQALKCPVVTGAIPPEARLKIARAGHKIIVATMRSLSEGVDLSYARAVVYFECDYTPGTMTQTLMRVQRWGVNQAPVRAYYLLCERTVDNIVYDAAYNRQRTIVDIAKEALLLTHNGA